MTFTEIGAAVGFLTGVYTLFDRFMRGRPLAYLSASGPATNALLHLRVKNMGQQDVLLRRLFSIPQLYQVSKDDSAKAIIEAQIYETPFAAVLQPGEHMDFPVFASELGRALTPESRAPCAFVISWRKASCPWLPQIPVCHFTSVYTIGQLKKAHRGKQ
jgi:hypothetical protein